jgi:hypothetical protein
MHTSRTGFSSTRDSIVYTADDTTGYDIIRVVVSLIEGTSQRTEIGEATAKVTVQQPVVTLGPDNRKIGPGDRLILRTEIAHLPPSAGELTYHWKCTNGYGSLSDGTFPGPVTEYYTGSDTAIYTAKSVGEGSDELTVTVYEEFGDIDQKVLGSDTARVFVLSSIFGLYPDSVLIPTLKLTGFAVDITLPGGIENIHYHWRCSAEHGDLADLPGTGDTNDFWNTSGTAIYTSRYNDYGKDSVWLDIYQQQGDSLVLLEQHDAVVVIGGPREYKLFGDISWGGRDDYIMAFDHLAFSWDNVSGFYGVSMGLGDPWTIRASKGDTLYWFAWQVGWSSSGCRQVSAFWLTDYADTLLLFEGVDHGCGFGGNMGVNTYFLRGQYVFPY